MKRFLTTIDDLLRGRLTSRENLAAGKIEIPLGTLVLAGVMLGAIYGGFMGLYAPLRPDNASYSQLLATICKVPLLFFLTLVVTYPSLYVVSALFDSQLRAGETLRLLLAAMTANLALLASLGPVAGFFTLCTDSYPFMIVLNVGLLGVAGFVGLGFLRKALDAVFIAEVRPAPPAPEPSGTEEIPRLITPRPRASKPASRRVFTVWTLIYGIVGAQMGWVLRPFIGSPNLPFELFRGDRESNFFAAFFSALGQLFT